jgi:hypothetical protein
MALISSILFIRGAVLILYKSICRRTHSGQPNKPAKSILWTSPSPSFLARGSKSGAGKRDILCGPSGERLTACDNLLGPQQLSRLTMDRSAMTTGPDQVLVRASQGCNAISSAMLHPDPVISGLTQSSHREWLIRLPPVYGVAAT